MACRKYSEIPPLKTPTCFIAPKRTLKGVKGSIWKISQEKLTFCVCVWGNHKTPPRLKVLLIRSHKFFLSGSSIPLLVSNKEAEEIYPEPIDVVKERELEKVFIVHRIYLCFSVANDVINYFTPTVIKHSLSWRLGVTSNQSFHKEVRACKMHHSHWFTISLTRAIHTGRTKLFPAAATMKLQSTHSLELMNHLFTNRVFSTDFFTFALSKSTSFQRPHMTRESSIWVLSLLSINLITKSRLKSHQWPRTRENGRGKRFCQQRFLMSS